MLVLRDGKEYRNGQSMTLKIQIRAKARDEILHMSGMNGVQVLPRGEGGEVDVGFRVVWLTGVSHEQASVRARQSDATFGVVKRPGRPPSMGIRVKADGYRQMRPVLTLSEDTTEHIASILKFKIEPVPRQGDDCSSHCPPRLALPAFGAVDPPEWVLTFAGGHISITPWLRQGKGKGKGLSKPTINLDLSSYGNKVSWGSYTTLGVAPTIGVPSTLLAQKEMRHFKLQTATPYPENGTLDTKQTGRIAELERQLIFVAARLDGAEKIQAKNNEVMHSKMDEASSSSTANLQAMEARLGQNLQSDMSAQMAEFRNMMMMQTSMIQNLMVQKQTEGPPDTLTGTMDGALAGTEMIGGAVRTMPAEGNGASDSRMVRPRLDVKPEKMELDYKVEDGSEEPADEGIGVWSLLLRNAGQAFTTASADVATADVVVWPESAITLSQQQRMKRRRYEKSPIFLFGQEVPKKANCNGMGEPRGFAAAVSRPGTGRLEDCTSLRCYQECRGLVFLYFPAPGVVWRVVCFYELVTTGHSSGRNAIAQNDVFLAELMGFASSRVSLPTLVVGDFNMPREKSEALQRLCTEGYVDLAELQSHSQGVPPTPTCSSGGLGTRPDRVYACHRAREAFIELRVCHMIRCSKHAHVFLSFKVNVAKEEAWGRRPALETTSEKRIGRLTHYMETQLLGVRKHEKMDSTDKHIGRGKQTFKRRSLPRLPTRSVSSPYFELGADVHSDMARRLGTQVRRMFDLEKKMGSALAVGHSRTCNLLPVWSAILCAGGFHGGFFPWMRNRTESLPVIGYELPTALELALLVAATRSLAHQVAAKEMRSMKMARRESQAKNWTKGGKFAFGQIRKQRVDEITTLKEKIDVKTAGADVNCRLRRKTAVNKTNVLQIDESPVHICVGDEVSIRGKTHAVIGMGGDIAVLRPAFCPVNNGCVVTFARWITSGNDLRRCMARPWLKIWNSVPDDADRWGDFKAFAAPLLPFSPMEEYKLDVQDYRKAITKARSHSALGGDQWSAPELRAFPDEEVEVILEIFDSLSNDEIPWDDYSLEGIIVMIAKIAKPLGGRSSGPPSLCPPIRDDVRPARDAPVDDLQDRAGIQTRTDNRARWEPTRWSVPPTKLDSRGSAMVNSLGLDGPAGGLRVDKKANWNPPQYAEEFVQTDKKAGADPSPAQVAWRRHIANTALPSSCKDRSLAETNSQGKDPMKKPKKEAPQPVASGATSSSTPERGSTTVGSASDLAQSVRVSGMLPGRSVSDTTSRITLRMELAVKTEVPVCGGVGDIVKCFNKIPWAPIESILMQAGAVAGPVKTWMQGLRKVTRRLRMQGSLGEAMHCAGGFPEGDPLSIVSAILIGHLWCCGIAARDSTARGYAYADNLEFTCPSTTRALVHMQFMVWMNQLLGLEISLPKVRNSTATKRRAEALESLTRAQTSGRPFATKMSLVVRAVHAKGLYACEATYISQSDLDFYSAATARALGIYRGGYNKAIALFITAGPMADPNYYILWQRLLCLRRLWLGSAEGADDVRELLASAPLHYRQGQVALFLRSIHSIGWTCDGDGEIACLGGVVLHIATSPLCELLVMSQHDYCRHLTSKVNERSAITKAFHCISRQGSMMQSKCYGEAQTALMRVTLTLANVASDWKAKCIGESPDCEFCGEPDSVIHRARDCKTLEAVRGRHPFAITHFESDSELLTCHGLCEDTGTLDELRRRLQAITLPSTTMLPSSPSNRIPIFTDGTGNQSRFPSWRLAAGSVVHGGTGDLLLAFHLPGIAQTVPRSELFAGLLAIRIALFIDLYTDHQGLFEGICALNAGGGQELRCSQNGDIWRMIANELDDRPAGAVVAYKVKSHSSAHEDNSDRLRQRLVDATQCFLLDLAETALRLRAVFKRKPVDDTRPDRDGAKPNLVGAADRSAELSHSLKIRVPDYALLENKFLYGNTFANRNQVACEAYFRPQKTDMVWLLPDQDARVANSVVTHQQELNTFDSCLNVMSVLFGYDVLPSLSDSVFATICSHGTVQFRCKGARFLVKLLCPVQVEQQIQTFVELNKGRFKAADSPVVLSGAGSTAIKVEVLQKPIAPTYQQIEVDQRRYRKQMKRADPTWALTRRK
ncbi:unnamed protein product, partial [Polarella glacialis]